MKTKDLIKEILKAKGFTTQKQLAAALNISQSRITEWNKGAELKFSVAFKYCEMLGLNLWEIIKNFKK